jgi:carbon monoxide dehydrogenase subunit G
MKLEQSFEVQAPLQRVWEALIDVERVAPCLPGASVTGRNPDGSYNGEFKVKIGPTSASYSGKLQMEDIDEATHSAVIQAAGTDKRGQGGAKATIVSSIAQADGGATTVNVNTDYHITGRLARFGRGGMIEEISNRLLGEFASSLQGMLAGSGDPPPVVETKAEPVPPAPAAADTAPEPTPADTAPEFAAAGNGGAASAPPPPPAEPVAPPPPTEPIAPPPSDPVPPPTPPTAGPTAGPATQSEPLDAVSLMRAVVVKKVKTNPAPYVGVVVGLVVAIRVLRRRRR